MTHPNNVAIIGAGPAGLTAGYLLSMENVPVTILEADATYVGGIARTAKYKGYHFDIGGDRFFSYPLKAGEALMKLGIFESTRCVLSYLKARLLPVKDPKNFEEWVSN